MPLSDKNYFSEIQSTIKMHCKIVEKDELFDNSVESGGMSSRKKIKLHPYLRLYAKINSKILGQRLKCEK